MSFAAVQKHVAVLERAGLVSKRRSGREALASGEVEAIRSVASLLEEFEAVWRGRIQRIDDLLARLRANPSTAPVVVATLITHPITEDTMPVTSIDKTSTTARSSSPRTSPLPWSACGSSGPTPASWSSGGARPDIPPRSTARRSSRATGSATT